MIFLYFINTHKIYIQKKIYRNIIKILIQYKVYKISNVICLSELYQIFLRATVRDSMRDTFLSSVNLLLELYSLVFFITAFSRRVRMPD